MDHADGVDRADGGAGPQQHRHADQQGQLHGRRKRLFLGLGEGAFQEQALGVYGGRLGDIGFRGKARRERLRRSLGQIPSPVLGGLGRLVLSQRASSPVRATMPGQG
jgi:hypothetical protein